MRVYLLLHIHELANRDDEKLIGVYSTEEKAQEARERAKQQPGFRDFPEEFFIDPYSLDGDHWREGFVNTYPGLDQS